MICTTMPAEQRANKVENPENRRCKSLKYKGSHYHSVGGKAQKSTEFSGIPALFALYIPMSYRSSGKPSVSRAGGFGAQANGGK